MTIRAARTIAKAIGPAETTLDTTIVANANLIATIVQARLDANTPIDVGHDAFMSAAAGFRLLADVREHVVRCHTQLAGVRDDCGMSGSDVGCHIGKYQDPPRGAVGEAVAA
ncbi:MAG: hypothetical protein V4537_16095 [Pseudomonadota bacterium]